MKDDKIPLTDLQNAIMREFYSIARTKVIFNKTQRNKIWIHAKQREIESDCLDDLKIKCPALAHQIQKSLEQGNNIQSAIFSECVYAQTLANMFKLVLFINCSDNNNFIPLPVKNLISSYNLVPRYVYSTKDKSRMLIQAGSCDGIDSALITVINLVIYTIEFKEPSAKASEADLPKYGEDGNLKITEKFLKDYPQFESMANEQKDLDFFANMGHNVNNFSKDSVKKAISNNYVKKYADVICTEDIDGYFVMMPANQVQLWAKLEGEIRPSGRNHYKVWTPKALRAFLLKIANVDGNTVKIEKSILEARKERGGNGRISGYKINPLFFVYSKDCKDSGSYITFKLESVRQLKPTISAKMFFNDLKYEKVKSYYQF